jgi:lipoprotein-anchoring transpeptidase ErfK/SrfK
MRLADTNATARTLVAVMGFGLALSGSTSAKSDLVVPRFRSAPPALESPLPATQPRPKRLVLVSIPDRKLAVLEDGKVLRVFLVAVGADVSPSPTGKLEVAHRLANPTYYHPGVIIPPGKDNPLGPRWVGLSQKGFGIHGTNQPWSIGKAASHGCIRMRNRDIVQFFDLVSVGDAVEIRAERDEQITEVFGPAQAATAVARAEMQAAPEKQN